MALFRVGLGLMLFCDVVKRSLTLREHYTADGVFPGAIASQLEPDFWLFRVFLLSDRTEVQALLFVVAAVLAVCVLVGYRTKLATILSFVFLVSIIRRNPYACHTGDIWLEVQTFWAMFLPLGACFSIDRLRGRAPRIEGNAFFSVATIAVFVQLWVFYFMAGYLKHGYELWVRGEALHVFTGIVEYTRPFGAVLGQHPGLCRFLTYFTLVLEMGGPFLLFVPFFTAQLRLLMIVLFAGFHLAIQLSVYIGIFELLSIVALLQVLPALFWDSVLPRVPVLGSIARMARRRRPRLRPGFARPLPRGIAAGGQILAGLSLAMVLVSNLNTARTGTIRVPRKLDDYARQIGLIQNWNVFTDLDNLFFGWYLVLGQTNEGRVVDVQAGTDYVGIQAPEHPAESFTNHNQRRFWGQAARPGQEWLRFHLARHLQVIWNEEHADPLFHLAIFHIASAPGRGQKRQGVRRLYLQEFPRPDLDRVSEEEQREADELRRQWRLALGAIPAFVVP